jgi:hypothetical protein
VTSIDCLAILGVSVILLPRISAGGERLRSAIATRLTSLLTLAIMLASLTQRSATNRSPQFWQAVTRAQKALAARTAFAGSPGFIALVELQIVLVIVICQGASSDFTSLAILFMLVVSAFVILLVATLYEVTTDALASRPAVGVAIHQTLGFYLAQIPDWIAPVPLPPPRRS